MLILLSIPLSKETSTSVSNLFQFSSLTLQPCKFLVNVLGIRDKCWLSKDIFLKYSSGTKNISLQYGTAPAVGHNVACSKHCWCCRGWPILTCSRVAQLFAGCFVAWNSQRVSHSHHSLFHHWLSLGTAMDCQCCSGSLRPTSTGLMLIHSEDSTGCYSVVFLWSWSSTKAVHSSQYPTFCGPSVFCLICLKSSAHPKEGLMAGVSSMAAQIPPIVWLTIASCKICVAMQHGKNFYY